MTGAADSIHWAVFGSTNNPPVTLTDDEWRWHRSETTSGGGSLMRPALSGVRLRDERSGETMQVYELSGALILHSDALAHLSEAFMNAAVVLPLSDSDGWFYWRSEHRIDVIDPTSVVVEQFEFRSHIARLAKAYRFTAAAAEYAHFIPRGTVKLEDGTVAHVRFRAFVRDDLYESLKALGGLRFARPERMVRYRRAKGDPLLGEFEDETLDRWISEQRGADRQDPAGD